MQKIFAFTLLLAIACLASHPMAAQVRNPVKWFFSVKSNGPGRYEVVARAILEKGWYIFSQSTPDGGPIPTSFRLNRNPLVILTGPVKEVGKMENRYDKLFGVDVRRYSEEVSFVQVVTVKGRVKTNVSVRIDYMLCNDKECLPPMTNNFIVELK